MNATRQAGRGPVAMGPRRSLLLTTEDWWAVWLGLGIVLFSLFLYHAGMTDLLKSIAVEPPKWEDWGTVGAHFVAKGPWYAALGLGFLGIFTFSTRLIGYRTSEYAPGFLILFVASTAILVLSNAPFARRYNLEAPLLALIFGLLYSNVFSYPDWLRASLRTEYYIKTGIVLLGATLPLTLILAAGPVAFLQATIVSVCTWLTIFLAATRIFKQEPSFGAVLGAAGSVCGISASIAVGAAVNAKKEYIAISSGIVTIWAIIMIFFIPLASRALGLAPGVAGAWVGTSEFADAAGFAAASAIPSPNDAPIQAFTLMKVIGRDVWVGIWCFVLSIVSAAVWERGRGKSAERVGVGVIWQRFPKFVIGFAVASVLMSMVLRYYHAESGPALDALKGQLIGPIKTLRTWAFVFTFLCIGLETRFRALARFGWEPFWAFTAGVLVNVPLGYFLSAHVFKDYWLKLG
ncbi:MAG: putative sulfate exporter family transporter [Pseudomonadota bacterium]